MTPDPGTRRRTPPPPRNQQRQRVLQLVRDQADPVDAATLAQRIGLHVTTVRFHLDALCEDGTVARTRIRRSGVGRPRTGYVAVRNRLDYHSLAEVLALELGDTVEERRQRAERAGERWAGRIIADEARAAVHAPGAAGPGGSGGRPAGRRPRSTQESVARSAAMISDIFHRMGFEPEPDAVTGSERTIRLHGCPVRELARSHPEVSCAMHRGLLRGLLAAGGHSVEGVSLHAEMDPFVEPELCVARLTPSPIDPNPIDPSPIDPSPTDPNPIDRRAGSTADE